MAASSVEVEGSALRYMVSSLCGELSQSCVGSYEESYSYSSKSMYMEDESLGDDSAVEGSIDSGDVEGQVSMRCSSYAEAAYEDVSRCSWM